MGRDVPDSLPLRKAVRQAHLDRLRELQRQGRLVIAGPFPAIDAPDLAGGVTGSLIVAEFPDLESAQVWAAADPYANGVFASVEVKPFLRVLPE